MRLLLLLLLSLVFNLLPAPLRCLVTCHDQLQPLATAIVNLQNPNAAVYLQGTSRGGADIDEIVRRISLWSVNMLFVVGGNGGNAAANAIHLACTKANVHCAVIGCV